MATKASQEYNLNFSETMAGNIVSVRCNEMTGEIRNGIVAIFKGNYSDNPRFQFLYRELLRILDKKNHRGIFVLFYSPGKIRIIGYFYLEFPRFEEGTVILRFLNIDRKYRGLGIGKEILKIFKDLSQTHILRGTVPISSPIGHHYMETVGANIVGISDKFGGTVFDLKCDHQANKVLATKAMEIDRLLSWLQIQKRMSKSLGTTRVEQILGKFTAKFLVREYADEETLVRETHSLTREGYVGTRFFKFEEKTVLVFECLPLG